MSDFDQMDDIVGAIKIKDGVFLGDEYAAQDLEFIVSNKVAFVINCAALEVPNHWESLGVQYLSYSWYDNNQQILLDGQDIVARQSFEFMEHGLNNGDSILIHSVKGQNRSFTMLAAYMMRKYKWTLLKTLEFLNYRRPDLDIRTTFVQQLIQYEHRLKSQGLGAQSSQWSEVSAGNNNLSSEELLLRNTYLNAQNAPFVQYVYSPTPKTNTLFWSDDYFKNEERLCLYHYEDRGDKIPQHRMINSTIGIIKNRNNISANIDRSDILGGKKKSRESRSLSASRVSSMTKIDEGAPSSRRYDSNLIDFSHTGTDNMTLNCHNPFKEISQNQPMNGNSLGSAVGNGGNVKRASQNRPTKSSMKTKKSYKAPVVNSKYNNFFRAGSSNTIGSGSTRRPSSASPMTKTTSNTTTGNENHPRPQTASSRDNSKTTFRNSLRQEFNFDDDAPVENDPNYTNSRRPSSAKVQKGRSSSVSARKELTTTSNSSSSSTAGNSRSTENRRSSSSYLSSNGSSSFERQSYSRTSSTGRPLSGSGGMSRKTTSSVVSKSGDSYSQRNGFGNSSRSGLQNGGGGNSGAGGPVKAVMSMSDVPNAARSEIARVGVGNFSNSAAGSTGSKRRSGSSSSVRGSGNQAAAPSPVNRRRGNGLNSSLDLGHGSENGSSSLRPSSTVKSRSMRSASPALKNQSFSSALGGRKMRIY
mmetsp:Transcript_38235/g.43392  ORF Transcript_38235/g.43392 Transcript_38235/m.43392 type:complete len:697 (-) Transcript_38235:2729-4819(-)